MKRVALEQADHGEGRTEQGTVGADGIGGVVRAGRGKAAAGRAEPKRAGHAGGDERLIAANECEEQPGRQVHNKTCQRGETALMRRWSEGRFARRPRRIFSPARGAAIGGRGARDQHEINPGGASCCWRRNTSRRRRLARLRKRAWPTAAVEAITQTRGAEFAPEAAGTSPVGAESRRFHQRVKARHSTRRPSSRTARISSWRRRCCSGQNAW